MNTIDLKLCPLKKGQFVLVFFDSLPFTDTFCMGAELDKDELFGHFLMFSPFEENLIKYIRQYQQKITQGFCCDEHLALEMRVGSILQIDNVPYLKVIAKEFMPFSPLPILVMECVQDMQDKLGGGNGEKVNFKNYHFQFEKNAYSLAVITLSDKGFLGERADESAPALIKRLETSIDFSEIRYFVLPDEKHLLRGMVASLANFQGFDCIITTGGTGISERDITPDALLPLVDKRLHGIEQLMMQKSLEKTPRAAISRSFCGVLHRTLLISVPGSVKGATENIEAILPVLPHTLAKLGGDTSDCGRK